MGMVGAIVITKWTFNLLKQTSPILLDENIDSHYREAIHNELAPLANVADLHIWRVSGHHYAAAITLVSKADISLGEYKQILSKFDKIEHLTLEVHSA